MPPQEPALYEMLYDALTSHARRIGVYLGEDAAQFIVNHAIQNIHRVATSDEERYSIASRAINELPRLEQTIRGYTTNTGFPDRASVVALMETCDGPYPWCSKVP
jgi:hypothetical protein